MVLSTFFINNPENNKLLNIQEARKSEEEKINSTSNLTNLFGKKRGKNSYYQRKENFIHDQIANYSFF